MTAHSYTFAPDLRPAVHPSDEVVYLPTGRTRVTCVCGARFTLPPQEEPQRFVPGRATLFVVQRGCI
jgi:hypothetical protein